MRNLTPEQRERLRRLGEAADAHRAQAERIFAEVAARQREREARAGGPGFWRRLTGSRTAA